MGLGNLLAEWYVSAKSFSFTSWAWHRPASKYITSYPQLRAQDFFFYYFFFLVKTLVLDNCCFPSVSFSFLHLYVCISFLYMHSFVLSFIMFFVISISLSLCFIPVSFLFRASGARSWQ